MESTEIWLRTNRRALAFGAVAPLLLAAIGIALALGEIGGRERWVVWLGAAMMLVGGSVVVLLAWQMRVPRVAYRAGEIMFNLQQGPPLRVPLDVVEAFFVGQQPVDVPGHSGRHAALNLVARLSQRATQWHERDVKPALGRWSEGYITICGTWCEPIDGELIRRLNRRLREVKEGRKV